MKVILISAIIGLLVGSLGTFATLKKMERPINLECNPAACNCPEQKPCNGIDFDKIKSRAITIQNTQYLTVNGDTILVDLYIKALQKELSKVRLAKCR